jgi:drug/metabolite transporter superfamily protein YnfA
MQALLQARLAIARELVEPIRASVVRRDSWHAAFHGCVDWHSAVHGIWALTAYARLTGEAICDAILEETLRPETLAAERALLAARPEFEMPYGRAWFLRLAREHALYTRSTTLEPMAGEVLGSMLDYYRGRPPDPRRGSYGSDSWALLNMLDGAVWWGDGAAEAAIRGLIETHFVDHGGGCDYALEGGHFMAVATNWAWLVSKVLPRADFARWAQEFFAWGGLPRPVLRPANWHHHGLNFSRAWGLWALHAAVAPGEARQSYLEAYVAHFRTTYDTPALWRGSYGGVSHWVPQFGMLALHPLFEG